ncbi:serine carboxypeptidase-like 26 [Telopea speciosissima]|uniref:serine carboxypeptidase-like 26 n=1 Tax=Telopea speciosissima TaxID=54955 RepID=UPI001CC5FF85|nr:serine carboxypeptidase-like 26 [Telopea speciosissima]
MKTTAGNFLPLFLCVSLLFGFLVSISNGSRQGEAFRVFRKIKATEGVDTTHDLTQVLPDFNPELIPQEGSKESDKILKLPGQPKDVNFGQYGGYITVNKTAGRALYYYFAEVDPKDDSKPLIIWFNGGPGCSSLGYGAFEEVGPFLVRGENLIENPYSWNKLGNLLFIESPAGVGFSYSNMTSDYTSTGDSRTAKDAYTFLLHWLERFPEHKNKDVYIAGESYAGHYVPQLAYTIVQQNKKCGRIINLKGISIGNPIIHDIDDRSSGDEGGGSLGLYEFQWKHHLISDESWNAIHTICDFNVPIDERTNDCKVTLVVNFVRIGDNIDPYNIYGPKCYEHNTSSVTSGPVGSGDPCAHNQITTYLDRPEVVKALNAKFTRFDEGYPSPDDPRIMIGKWDKWAGCSGDLDSVVAYTCTRNSIKRLGLTEKKKWHLWGTDEISGTVVTYEGNVTLATVRGAGHEVPMDQPRRGFELIQSFLEGTQLPKAKPLMNLAEMGINEDDVD